MFVTSIWRDTLAEVIDIYQQPELAQKAQIIAAPTLVKSLPLPLRRLVGDLSNRRRVLMGLDLVEARTEEGKWATKRNA